MTSQRNSKCKIATLVKEMSPEYLLVKIVEKFLKRGSLSLLATEGATEGKQKKNSANTQI